MNKIMLAGVSVLFAATAFAKGPIGQGNFRRAEILKAAGVKNVYTTHVRGAACTDHYAQGERLPKGSRVMLVEHLVSGDRYEVDAVKAPVDKSRPVEKMSTREIHGAGLITQGEARKLASHNGGALGTKGTVHLKDAGLSQRGSYAFEQTKPSTVTRKQYRASNISRTVTVTGSGESASGYYEAK